MTRYLVDSRILVAILTALLRPCRSVSSIKDGCYSVEVNLPEWPEPAESEGTEAVSESRCINTRVGCQPPAAETHRVPISLSLLPLLLLCRTLSLSLALWVGWLWVAGSYATGIDIPGGQTVNSRLVRTESVVGLHNMVVPLFHPPPHHPPYHPRHRQAAREGTKEGRYHQAGG